MKRRKEMMKKERKQRTVNTSERHNKNDDKTQLE